MVALHDTLWLVVRSSAGVRDNTITARVRLLLWFWMGFVGLMRHKSSSLWTLVNLKCMHYANMHKRVTLVHISLRMEGLCVCSAAQFVKTFLVFLRW